ncbi:ankyrin repeat domain-containing protein 10b [Engraulis encrasicolus]|uniref:ankyrin repeat domain-containing protein 10b n=1 Tax=Engraulis encrasicolus TaxID=184585 RepID=UPI002FD34CA9
MLRMSVGIESGFSSEEVLNIRFPLHRACRDGDVGALCSILQRTTNQADLAVEDSFYGWTPLHWAAHFGKLECVMRLVQVGCGVNSQTSRFAQTPTHIAAFGGHPDCLLWLLQAGADINRQDYVGESPIHKAARAGSIDCINALLMRGAKADVRNASGLTAADLAHAQGFQECAQLLANAQNQQLNSMTNGSMAGGDPQAIQQMRTFLRGAPSRKRSLDTMEPDHFKKARTDALPFPMKALNGCGGQEDLMMEAMHMESCAAPSTGDLLNPGPDGVPRPFSNGHGMPPATANGNGFPGNSLSNPVSAADIRCGGVGGGGGGGGGGHLGSSTHGAGATLNGNYGNGLHFGHLHGLGDTAENVEEVGSEIDHHTSIKAEEHYDHMLYSTMLLYHGS